jgi:hypothetical protein
MQRIGISGAIVTFPLRGYHLEILFSLFYFLFIFSYFCSPVHSIYQYSFSRIQIKSYLEGRRKPHRGLSGKVFCFERVGPALKRLREGSREEGGDGIETEIRKKGASQIFPLEFFSIS